MKCQHLLCHQGVCRPLEHLALIKPDCASALCREELPGELWESSPGCPGCCYTTAGAVLHTGTCSPGASHHPLPSIALPAASAEAGSVLAVQPISSGQELHSRALPCSRSCPEHSCPAAGRASLSRQPPARRTAGTAPGMPPPAASHQSQTTGEKSTSPAGLPPASWAENARHSPFRTQQPL